MRALPAGPSACALRRRFVAATVTALAAVCLTLSPVQARAADLFSPFTLDWQAPAGCPEGEAVEQETARLLHGAGRDGAAPLQARATVERMGPKVWRMRLRTAQEGPERIVDAATCRELGDAAAFILAAAVDPNNGEEEEAPSPPSSPPPPRQARLLPESPVTPLDPHEVPPPQLPLPPRRSSTGAAGPMNLALSLALWIDGGLMPAAAYAPAIGLSYRPARELLLESALAYFPHSHAFTEGDADFALGALDVRAGYVLAPGRFEAALIGGGELDWLYGRGDGGLAAGTGGAFFLSVLLGWRVSYEILPGWAARLEVDGVVPLERPQYTLDASTIVHEPSVIGGRFSVGLERRF
jgi:hypothetical protein